MWVLAKEVAGQAMLDMSRLTDQVSRVDGANAETGWRKS